MPMNLRFLKGQTLKNLLALVVINYGITILATVTNIAMANKMGKFEYGKVAYGLAIGLYAATLVLYSSDRTLVRDLTHYKDRFNEMVLGSLYIRGAIFAIVTLALLLGASRFQLTAGTLMIVLSVAMVSLDFQAVFDQKNDMKRHAAYLFASKIAFFAIIWLAVILAPKRLTVGLVGFGMLLGSVVFLALQARWIHRNLPGMRGIKAMDSVRYQLRTGFPVWVASFIFLSFSTLNQLFLKAYKDTGELGVYAVAFQTVSAGSLFINQIARIGKRKCADVTLPDTPLSVELRFLAKYLGAILGTSVLIYGPVYLLAPFVLKVLFHDEYAGAVPILRILCAYSVVFSAGIVFSQYIIALHREKTYLLCVSIGAAICILSCMWLIPKHSGLGAAYALLLAYAANALLYFAMICQHAYAKRKSGKATLGATPCAT